MRRHVPGVTTDERPDSLVGPVRQHLAIEGFCRREFAALVMPGGAAQEVIEIGMRCRLRLGHRAVR